VLNPPNPSTEFVWAAASVPAGTEILFSMSDSEDRVGGTSGIIVSGATGDTSCLNSNSPSLTSQGTASTTTSPASSSVGGQSASSTISGQSASSSLSGHSIKGSGTNLTPIIATVAVALVALVAVVTFLYRRYRRNQSPRHNLELDGESLNVPAVSFPAITLVQLVIKMSRHICFMLLTHIRPLAHRMRCHPCCRRLPMLCLLQPPKQPLPFCLGLPRPLYLLPEQEKPM
jgi:preprotein translocase subunit SecG